MDNSVSNAQEQTAPKRVLKQLTIALIKEPEGGAPGKITFKESGKTFKFWAWAQFWKDGKLVIGETAEAGIEQVPSKNPQFPADDFLVSWNGIDQKAPKSGFGGKGAFVPRGKAAVEIGAELAGIALQEASAFHSGQDSSEEDVLNTAGDFMRWLVDSAKRAKGELS